MKIITGLISILLVIGCTKENIEVDIIEEVDSIEIEEVVQEQTIDIAPDKIISHPLFEYQMDVNEDGIFDVVFSSFSYDGNNSSFLLINAQPLDNNKIAGYNQSPAINDIAYCSENMTIPDSVIWSNSICTMYSYSYQALPPPGSSSEGGLWLGKTDHVLTVQYIVDGETLYAWIKMSHLGGSSFVIKEFTYQYLS